MSILQAFKDDDFRIGDLQAIAYSTSNPIFPEDFISILYGKMKGDMYSNRRPNGTGILETLFFGMDVSWASITSYLAKVPIIVMGIWQEGEFIPAGFMFRTIALAKGRSCMMGYVFFREFWGSEYSEALGMLGISLAFQEGNLDSIHGMRIIQNYQTRKFLTPYGFKDTGLMPRWELRRGKLVDAVTSCLLREDFEAYVERTLIAAYAANSPY